MIEIEVSAAGARLLQSEVLTSGRAGLRCHLHFDEAWDGLQKTAVVVGSRSQNVLLRDKEFTVPAVCLGRAGDALKIGLYGTNGDGTLIIPTVWVNCGEIHPGADLTTEEEIEVPPNLLAQIQALAAETAAIAAQLKQDAENGRFNGTQGERGAAGADGVSYLPSVSAQGVLSWTNDGGRPNPASADLVTAVLNALPDGDEVSY